MRAGPIPLARHVLAAWSQGDAALLARFHDGVRRYQASAWVRPENTVPAVWDKGSSRLLRYHDTGKPLLVIPSLINPSWILDLLPDNSFVSWLGSKGYQVYLLDWGVADQATRKLDLDGLVREHLNAALLAIGEPALVLGYCLGGTMALALAQLAPDQVSAMVLLAAPWLWSRYDSSSRTAMGDFMQASAETLDAWGAVPAEQLQVLFAELDPQLIVRKFADFADVVAGSAAERKFLAVEDWSNSGPPLSAPVARQLFGEWIAGGADGWSGVDPLFIATPTLVVTATADRIVPESVSAPLAGMLPNATRLAVNAGHVGMVAGSKAIGLMWEPVAAWLQTLA